MIIKTDHILNALLVLCWIIFVGLGIEAGGFITKTVATMVLTHDGATRFYQAVDLGSVYRFDESQYLVLSVLMIIVVVLKAIMFYKIIALLHNKKVSFARPFNNQINRFITILAWISVAIGVFSYWGAKVGDGLTRKGIEVPDLRQLRLAGSDVWLFMAVLLFVVAYIFKKGIEIQTENDLTV